MMAEGEPDNASKVVAIVEKSEARVR